LASGLRLQITLNATTVQAGSPLTAQVSLFNTLDTNLSLTPDLPANSTNVPAKSTIGSWNSYDFFCGSNPTWSLAGYALFGGYYSSGNISSAGKPLTMIPPVLIECPASTSPDRIVFLPDGSRAVAYYAQSASADASEAAMNATTATCAYTSEDETNCSGSTSLFGYWNSTADVFLQNATTSSQYFHYFSPGEYTLAVQDMWNQTIYAHFQVVAALSSPVEAVSVVGPIPPYNPGGPVISVTLKNVGDAPITSLNATLVLEPPPNNPGGFSVPYSFVFNVSSTNPLLPGQSTQDSRTLIGAAFETGLDYPLMISGPFADGLYQFSYTVEVQVVAPS
jgi:hypothetical protein